MNNQVGLNMDQFTPDNTGYAGGFGTSSQAEVDQLNKALEATHMTGGQSNGLTSASGAALKFESLDSVMKVVTFTEQNIVLWKNIPRKSANSTVEEFNQLTSYGQERGGFNNEGETPMEEDSIYVRRSQLVKYLGVTKSVSHQMMLVNTVGGSVMEREVTNGTLWLLRKLEKALTKANSKYIPQEFNGLYAQHAENDYFSSLDSYYNSEVVVDCRGKSLQEAHLEAGAEGIVQNYGFGNQFYAPPKVLSNFVKNFYGSKFFGMNPQSISDGVAGQRIQHFQSQYGTIGLNWDVFMNPDSPIKSNTAASSVLAPAAPTADATTPVAAVASDASSKWGSDDAGSYFYAVVAINRHGQSAPTVLSATAVSPVSGGAVTLKYAPTASANGNPTAYQIYRSNKNAASAGAATFYPLFTVAASELSAGYDGGSAGEVRDRNRIMPGTSEAFLIQNDSSVYEFAQLAPLMKMDLAITGPAYRFMLLHYGTPLMYAPKRMVKYINIGEGI